MEERMIKIWLLVFGMITMFGAWFTFKDIAITFIQLYQTVTVLVVIGFVFACILFYIPDFVKNLLEDDDE